MRICLVGATHPSFNPRLVREADALVDAGHQVRVVAPLYLPYADNREAALTENRGWRLQTVDFRPRGLGSIRALAIRARRRVAEEIYRRYWPTPAIAALGYAMAVPELHGVAAGEPADWFIAHTQAALPAAAEAARRWDARLGFDCEDLLAYAHDERREMVRAIETKYIRDCDYVSATSKAMGERLASDYGIVGPVVLYNVFPLELAKQMTAPPKRPLRSSVRLHWFGQTIGPGRGIEEAIEAMGHLPPEVELHLRGYPAAGFRSKLAELAETKSVAARVVFHPPVAHDELIGTLDEFDVGLALERPEHGNYARTVTNKVFSYMLGGLAIAATDTPGQREILEQVPTAGFLYSAGQIGALV
ncbi:MAG TPA: glycosyltransferase, partial [Terriglobales bacterium]|nr:glycosyltransferase [Terriglobales bacterium]